MIKKITMVVMLIFVLALPAWGGHMIMRNRITSSGGSGVTRDFHLDCEGADATARATADKVNDTGTIVGTYNTISDMSSTQAHGGTYSVGASAVDEYVEYVIPDDDTVINDQEGYVSLWVYLNAADSGNTRLWKAFQNGAMANNFIDIQINWAEKIYVVHKGNGTSVSVTSTNSITLQTWMQIQVKWSVINNKLSVKLGSDAWDDDSDADAVTAFALYADRLYVGPYGNYSSGPVYIDDVETWSTYDQS